MEAAKNVEFSPKQSPAPPRTRPMEQVAPRSVVWQVPDMARKKLIVLDPENSFEAASRHLYRCRKCKNAGMEWARRKDLCRRGRQLLQDLDKVEQIYEAVERAA